MGNKPIKFQLLTKLYSSNGNSITETAKKLNCSVHKVVYWMEKFNISRRSQSEALYLKLNPQGDPFKIKRSILKDENYLYGLGIGIYWGEGDKIRKNAIRVANTDPNLIIQFRRFLLEICQIEPRKIGYSIVCFNDSDVSGVVNYWSNQLGVSTKKFGKIVQIPMQGKGTYKRKSKYGVCTITVSNVKLKDWITTHLYFKPGLLNWQSTQPIKYAGIAQLAERGLGKSEVSGSIPDASSK